MQAGAAAWKRVEGIMWDRNIGNIGTNKETGREDTDSRKQLGLKNMQSNPRR